METLTSQAALFGEKIGDVVVSTEQIATRLTEIGKQINADYEGRAPVLIGVLKGAFVLMADLVRHLDLPVTVDFMAVASYGSATRSSGVVRILKDLDVDIEGRDVIVVEDIIDSGLTLRYLVKNLKSRSPASLEVFAFLVKDTPRADSVDVRYTGFRIPDKFVVGYGLDVAERYRNLPDIRLFSSAD